MAEVPLWATVKAPLIIKLCAFKEAPLIAVTPLEEFSVIASEEPDVERMALTLTVLLI